MLIGNLTFMLGHKVIKSEDKLGDKVGQKDFTAAQQDEEKAERAREAATPLTKVEKDRILAILITGVFVIFFWMAFEQAGNTLTTWADQKTNQSVFGLFNAKASLFQAVNPLFVVALAPLISEAWKKLGEKNLEPSSPIEDGARPFAARSRVRPDGHSRR